MPDYLIKVKKDKQRVVTTRVENVTFAEAFVQAVIEVDRKDPTLTSVTVELAKVKPNFDPFPKEKAK